MKVCYLGSAMCAAGQLRRGVWVGTAGFVVIRKAWLEPCVGQDLVMNSEESDGCIENVVGYICLSKEFGYIKVRWKPQQMGQV